jgi:chromosome segregation ATPase
MSPGAWDELAELRRVHALARGYLRQQLEGTQDEEIAWRSRLARQLERVDARLDVAAEAEAATAEERERAELIEQLEGARGQVEELRAQLDAAAADLEERDATRDEFEDAKAELSRFRGRSAW